MKIIQFTGLLLLLSGNSTRCALLSESSAETEGLRDNHLKEFIGAAHRSKMHLNLKEHQTMAEVKSDGVIISLRCSTEDDKQQKVDGHYKFEALDERTQQVLHRNCFSYNAFLMITRPLILSRCQMRSFEYLLCFLQDNHVLETFMIKEQDYADYLKKLLATCSPSDDRVKTARAYVRETASTVKTLRDRLATDLERARKEWQE